MVGPTAQLVALACQFNGGSRGVASPFFAMNSTCQFCEYVQFVRREGRWFGRRDWKVVADSPDQWLAGEVRPSRRAIITREAGSDPRLSDRMSAGFVGGGGTWKLWIVEKGLADVWNPSWQVGNRAAPDRRIWQVTYAQSAMGVAHTIVREPLEPLRNRLQKGLSEALAFCDRHTIDGFASQFRNAIACLSSVDPFSLIYHKDLAPPDTLTLPAQQMLSACSAAWVFGGMGSWNDLYFDRADRDDYERISEELFGAMNESIVAATNSGASLRTKKTEKAS